MLRNTEQHKNWLKRRRQGIGGSDIAGIFGLSNYSTPYTVWADKMGRLPEKEETPQMRLGTDLEWYVARRFFEETGLRVHRDGRTFTNPKYPYSFAHIDRRITGEHIGLECKTCSPYRAAEFTDEEYPIEYHTQALHYLAVTGWEKWYIAVLILGVTFRIYEVSREKYQEEIDETQKTVAFFWENYVLTDTAPPMDGKKATNDALNEVHSDTTDSLINLPHLEENCTQIYALKKQIESIEEEQERYKQEIKLAMGDNERADLGAWFATWKPNKNGVKSFILKINNQ